LHAVPVVSACGGARKRAALLASFDHRPHDRVTVDVQRSLQARIELPSKRRRKASVIFSGETRRRSTACVDVSVFSSRVRRISPSNDVLLYDFDNGNSEKRLLRQVQRHQWSWIGRQEAILGAGDSGGPNFIDGKIAGITSFTFFNGETTLPDGA